MFVYNAERNAIDTPIKGTIFDRSNLSVSSAPAFEKHSIMPTVLSNCKKRRIVGAGNIVTATLFMTSILDEHSMKAIVLIVTSVFLLSFIVMVS